MFYAILNTVRGCFEQDTALRAAKARVRHRVRGRHIYARRPREGRLECHRGFTVIELMIVLTIGAILLAIGMPSFVDFMRESRAGSAMSALTGDLQLARSEAVKRNARVLLCARANPTSTACTAAPSATAWMNGWLVCMDRNVDGACDASTAADPNPIRVQSGFSAPVSVSGPAATIVYFPVGNASAGGAFTVTAETSTTRTATVAPSGTVVTKKTY